MSKYVVDAYAWIEYFIGSESGAEVSAILEKENSEIYTCAVTVAEIISKVAREGRDIKVAYDVLTSNSQVINADGELSKEAGLVHAEVRKMEKNFSLADAYVLATARKLKSKVLTGDLHFKGVKEAVLIK
jgi:predicted nucleic acid-binding protein